MPAHEPDSTSTAQANRHSHEGQCTPGLIDISNKLESLINQEISQWKPTSLKDLLAQVYCLSEAAAGFGFLELWEWDQLRKAMEIPSGKSMTLQKLSEFSDAGRQIAEWGQVWFVLIIFQSSISTKTSNLCQLDSLMTECDLLCYCIWASL